MADTDPAYYRDLLARRFAGRKVILTGMVAGATGAVSLLHELGAQKPFLLAEGIGTGKLPEEDALEWIVVGKPSVADLMEALRAYEAELASLPAEATSAVERYDPGREAHVIRGATLGLQRVAGRPVYGAKDPRWVALEDKTVADALWDRVGVPRAPSRVVRSKARDLQGAASELDQGLGTVWAADAREGWHGGSEGLRWIRHPDEAVREATWFESRCDHVRVMPFLEGIPCSIHGMVFPNTVIAFRPVEQLTLHRPTSPRFKYSGCATFWDPPEGDREEMRELAGSIGAALRSLVEFRGTFTVDGVMTADGFRPTELNPRYGLGMGVMSRSLPALPLEWIDQAVCEGEPWDFRPHDLEAMLIESADATRSCGARGWDPAVYEETQEHALVQKANGEYRRAAEGEVPSASIRIGPSPMGCFMVFSLEHEHNPVGVSVAPKAVEAFAFADRELGTSFGTLEAARVVR
jgi:hypothetical protein